MHFLKRVIVIFVAGFLVLSPPGAIVFCGVLLLAVLRAWWFLAMMSAFAVMTAYLSMKALGDHGAFRSH